jgi:ABC-type Zn uptake system ZnuABC Zn-binding protein ZnuA
MADGEHPISNIQPPTSNLPSRWVIVALAAILALSACAPAAAPVKGDLISAGGTPKVLAVETFLADIAQNVAGDRLKVDALLPVGVDPHSYEPMPTDVRKVADSTVLILNGAGFERFLEKLLANAGGQRLVIEASAGLTSRKPREGEIVEEGHQESDPHFWLDPVDAIKYVENIRDGLSKADPAGAAIYVRNADAYIARLRELDTWIADQVKQIPPERRLLVTNHESFGYFADRYGFRIVGTIIPSVSTDASPSAQQLARLVDQIKSTGGRAIFLETGTNPQLAQQIAKDAGVRVVAELYTHSVTPPGGKAPSYIEMMRYDTKAIVDALK